MPDHQQSKEHAARIEKLEESVAYTDHTAAELSKEIHELNRTVLDLVRRLARLEDRLVDLNSRIHDDPGQVPPPHSAGPDIPRDPL